MNTKLLKAIIISCLMIFGLSVISFAEEKIHISGDSGLKTDLREITLKVGTIAPAGTFASEAINTAKENFYLIKERFNLDVKVVGYYGGVMGDDPQMIQKARMGQLDMLGLTLSGLSHISKELDIFNLAYLIEDYGMFDYVMTQNSAFINNILYKAGWISLTLITSEGQHDLYLKENIKDPDELRLKLKACNYTGLPDNSFFEALKVPQVPISPTEMYVSMKSNVSNAALLPSAFVIGMQIYTMLPYIVVPKVRICTAALLMTKKKWETLPWDFRVYIALLQPGLYYAGNLARDASMAFADAMDKHGLKKITLSPEELRKWKEPIDAYRNTNILNDPAKKEIYDRIIKSVNEYKNSNPIEKRIYLSDPTYRNFPDKVVVIGDAFKDYAKNKNSKVVLELHNKNILEKWRVYDAAVAAEHYWKTRKLDMMYKWMRSYYITEVTDEIFKKHQDSIERLFGSEKAFMCRVDELSKAYDIGKGFYNGFQRAGLSLEAQKNYKKTKK